MNEKEKDEAFSLGNLPELGDLLAEFPTSPSGGNVSFHVASPADSLINATVGNYKILALIGEGGFGNVYKAHDASLGRDVAIKFLWGKPDASRRILFEREAKAVAALSKHPNIVDIYQWGEYEGRNYIVFEYVASNGLRLMEEHPDGVPVPVALRVVMECAEALHEAHRHNILHRDVKPANILIEPDSGIAKLTDFGLAHLGTSGEFTLEGRVSGSPSYMSPEQANAQTLDVRSDIFSLGVTLYELLCRKKPYEGVTAEEIIDKLRRNERVPLSERRPDLDKSIRDIVEIATAYKRENRYQDAGEMARHLRMTLQSIERRGGVSPVSVPDALPEGDKKKPANRFRKRAVQAVVAAGIVIVALYGLRVLLLTDERAGLKDDPTFQAGIVSMNQEDFFTAASHFEKVLGVQPDSDQARYGYCMALAHLGKTAEASELAAAIEAPELRANAEAAVMFLSRGGNAGTDIRALAEKNPTGYLKSLLGRLDVLEGNYAQAAETLGSVSEEQFSFAYQFADALEALGQARYHLGNYPEARAVFERVSQNAVGGSKLAARAYLSEIDSRLDETRRADISAKAADIRKLIDQAGGITENADEWTSRPLTFAVLPGEVKAGRLAVESGLADLLPTLLGNDLAEDTSMTMVDRELLRELLMEQELSGMLSTNEGRLRLGRVLGARLLVKCDFTFAGGGEKIVVTVDDTETTERIPVPVQDLQDQVALDGVAESLSKLIWKNVSGHYPIQGRLYNAEDSPEINIGAGVGVKSGMVFDILADPDAPPLSGAQAVVQGTPGGASAQVTLKGIDIGGANATEGQWLVRARRWGSV